MSKEVIIVGAGGHAKVVIATLEAAGFNVAAAFDDNPEKWGSQILGIKVMGPVSRSAEFKNCFAINAIGDNQRRRDVSRQLDLNWLTVCHPSSIVHSSVKIGRGTVVFAGVVIQPDVVIGEHCIINTSASIDHDCQIADFAHIAPGCVLSGGVKVGEGSLLGVGSKAKPFMDIGEWATIGAGSVIVKNIRAGRTALGVPAREIDLSRH